MSGEVAKLSRGLELHESRVSEIHFLDGVATIHFSHACIHDAKGTPGRDRSLGWSQAAQLVLSNVQSPGPLPRLPNTVAEGFLEVGGLRHEVLPLPFKRKVGAKLYLAFMDGAEIELIGTRPYVEMIGKPFHLG